MRNLKPSRPIIYALFSVYSILLAKLILFKRSGFWEIWQYPGVFADHLKYETNFVPFKTIVEYFFLSPYRGVAIENLVGNVILFLPMGFLLPCLTGKADSYKNVALASLVISMTFELTQLLPGMGSVDIDDVILNVAGSVTGYWALLYTRKIFLTKKPLS